MSTSRHCFKKINQFLRRKNGIKLYTGNKIHCIVLNVCRLAKKQLYMPHYSNKSIGSIRRWWWSQPVGTWRKYNVASTSMQRHDVASTLRRRYIYVMCLPGNGHILIWALDWLDDDNPSGYMMFIQCCINADATSWRWDVDVKFYSPARICK